MRYAHITLLLVAALGAGCGDDTPTSPTSTTPVTVTEQFAGTVPVGATRFYSYEVTSAGTSAITLASLSAPGSRLPSAARVQLGVGIPAGEGCAVSQSVVTAPALSAQLSVSQAAGIYCTSITDLGELTGEADFIIRIVHP
jgi:hypothetical protein